MSFFDEAMADGMEQEMQIHEEFNAFIRQNRAIWTPRAIFDKCCVKWLVDGREKHNKSYYQTHFLDEMNDGNVVGKGCDYCSLAHPQIVLSFDETKQVTVATLSHLLDPFVNVMEDQMNKGTATKVKEGVYHVDGFLGDVTQTIRAGSHIGKHLVAARKNDVLASKRARQKAAKELEATQKRKTDNTVSTKKRPVDFSASKGDRPAKQTKTAGAKATSETVDRNKQKIVTP